ncbi:hypothetical protein EVAR_101947_1 [Eumeta japonica]|uniref:Uncharacterized protein n=1 Tax=Eumeta variegata TaxID=151549 RepID=A0A4C1TSE1_EUMVA|nr:hypothetical protein EVAR_101947_1 [Eumeta japonica]
MKPKVALAVARSDEQIQNIRPVKQGDDSYKATVVAGRCKALENHVSDPLGNISIAGYRADSRVLDLAAFSHRQGPACWRPIRRDFTGEFRLPGSLRDFFFPERPATESFMKRRRRRRRNEAGNTEVFPV